MQPPLMLLVLIVHRAHMTYRSMPERADLFGPTGLPLDQEIDDTSLAHIALHPRCPGITARAVDAQADPHGIQDATQRLQRLEQVRSLSRPAPALWAGDRKQPVPAPAASGQ